MALAWYGVRTQYGVERRVADDIEHKLRLEAWSPSFRIAGDLAAPVLPCYAFCRFDTDDDGWQAIRDIRGAVKPLPLNAYWPVAIPQRLVDDFMMRTDRGEFDLRGDDRLVLKYRPGDRVSIVAGAMKGRIAQFVRQIREKAEIEFPLFGRMNSGLVPVGFIGDP